MKLTFRTTLLRASWLAYVCSLLNVLDLAVLAQPPPQELILIGSAPRVIRSDAETASADSISVPDTVGADGITLSTSLRFGAQPAAEWSNPGFLYTVLLWRGLELVAYAGARSTGGKLQFGCSVPNGTVSAAAPVRPPSRVWGWRQWPMPPGAHWEDPSWHAGIPGRELQLRFVVDDQWGKVYLDGTLYVVFDWHRTPTRPRPMAATSTSAMVGVTASVPGWLFYHSLDSMRTFPAVTFANTTLFNWNLTAQPHRPHATVASRHCGPRSGCLLWTPPLPVRCPVWPAVSGRGGWSLLRAGEVARWARTWGSSEEWTCLNFASPQNALPCRPPGSSTRPSPREVYAAVWLDTGATASSQQGVMPRLPACGWGHLQLRLRQTMRLGAMTVPDWTPTSQAVFEAAYGVAIGIYDAQTRSFLPGSSVSSSVMAARRNGLVVTFTAVLTGVQTTAQSQLYFRTAEAINATSFRGSIDIASQALHQTIPLPASIQVYLPEGDTPSPESSDTRGTALAVVLGFTGCLLCLVVVGAVTVRWESQQEDEEGIFGPKAGGETMQMQHLAWQGLAPDAFGTPRARAESRPEVDAKGDIMFAIPEEYSVNFDKN